MTQTIAVDPAPGQSWQSYSMDLPFENGQTPVSVSNAPNMINIESLREDIPEGFTDYLELDTLIVIYPDTAAGYINQNDIEIAKAQVRRAAEFYWRKLAFQSYIST